MTTIAREVDDKGRLTLGKSFANQLVLISTLSDGVVQIVRAKAVPDPELWLHSNPRAILAVMKGLQQARDGELVDGPDISEMSRLAGKMER